MRVAIVGAGGVGGYFGGKLAWSGVDTMFIARGATLDALRTRGLRVESIEGDFTLDHVNATDDPSSAHTNHTGTDRWFDSGGNDVANYGYFAGPDVHIIDPYGIGDPLMSRMHFPVGTQPWCAGHFMRPIPDGYTDAAIDRGSIGDPSSHRIGKS